LKGLGNPGINGGPSGDLYLNADVTEHHFFWRDGYDIHARVPISISQAAQGAKIRIRTIGGKKVELKIPPGTTSGTNLKLRGLGLSIGSRKGDMIVEIEIKIPANMTDEEKKLYEQLAGKGGSRN
jgi:DnaJ-class molecular chaperone